MGKRSNTYNRIFNEEDWLKVNKENKEIIEDFMLELKSTKKSLGTQKQYFNDLRIIAIYVLKNLDNKSFLELTKRHFRNINLWFMEDLGLSSARCNRLMSSVRSMLTYIEDSDEWSYSNNLASKVKGLPKEQVRDIIFISDEQVEKLREELIKRKDYIKALLLDMSYDSAGRRNELYQIEKDGLLDKNSTNVVVGKRGKKFPLLYFDKTKESLKLYLEQRGEDDIKSLWVINRAGVKREISYETLYDWFIYMNNILEDIEGKEIGFNAHSFRHSALENMARGTHRVCKKLNKTDGFSIEELAIYAHHSDISTTQSYLKSNDEEMLSNMFGINL